MGPGNERCALERTGGPGELNSSPNVLLHGRPQAWQGAAVAPAPWKCCTCKVLRISGYSQTPSRPVIMHYLEVRSGSFGSLACFEGEDLKKIVSFFEEKSAPPRENPDYAYEFAHPWKKILWAPTPCSSLFFTKYLCRIMIREDHPEARYGTAAFNNFSNLALV